MAERGKIYKCALCGKIVEVLKEGKGRLSCCGQEMELLTEKTAESSQEKHVPFIAREGDKYIVKVGQNAAHPMEEGHYIQWIELIADGISYFKFLKPQDLPQAEFVLPEAKDVSAREYCNLHGLWRG